MTVAEKCFAKAQACEARAALAVAEYRELCLEAARAWRRIAVESEEADVPQSRSRND